MNLQVKNLPFKGSGFWVFRGVTYVDHNWVLEYYTVLLFWYLLLKGISGKDKFLYLLLLGYFKAQLKNLLF